jgi:cytochrome c
VTTADGKTAFFLESDLRFKIDSSELGPDDGYPVIVPAGTEGDRAWLFFSSPHEIGGFIERRRS